MAEPAIRFPGARKRFPNLPTFAKEHLGYELQAADDDYVIAADDPALRLGSRPPLSAHGLVALSAKNRHKLSGILMSNLPRQMTQYSQNSALKINWNFFEDSQLTRAYRLQTDITVAQPDDVRRILRDRVIPFMVDEIDAVSVLPVTLNANLQQAYITFAKFGLLSNKHQSTIVSELVLERQAYKGILPSALDVLSYVSILTRLMPFALTVPISRSDFAWYFIPKRTLFFEHVHCTSLFSVFSNQISLLSRGPSLITLKELVPLNDNRIAAFLQLVVRAVANMMKFVNNMMNFVNHQTRIPEFGTQLQVYCSIHLLFANISALNPSIDGFQRISQAMGAIDKLANLRKYFSSQTQPEELIFQQIFSTEEKNRLEKIINDEVDEEGIKPLLLNTVDRAYDRLHAYYREDMRETGDDEQRRLQRVRNQRNLHHGAFLRGDKFHEVFGTSAGEAPDEVVAIAWLSTLCFAMAPQKYLGDGRAPQSGRSRDLSSRPRRRA